MPRGIAGASGRVGICQAAMAHQQNAVSSDSLFLACSYGDNSVRYRHGHFHSPMSQVQLAQRWLMSIPCAEATIGTHHQVQQAGLCLCARSEGAPWSLLQPHACRRGQDWSRFLTADEADLVRQQIDTGRQFRGHVDALWEACEQWADSQLADVPASSGEAKKGGPSGSPSRNRQGNRNSLRFWRGWRSGFRSRGDGGAATGSAAGRARTRATTERRYFRSCWPGTALLLRSASTVSRPSREDV